MKRWYLVLMTIMIIVGSVLAGTLCWNVGALPYVIVRGTLTMIATFLGAIFGLETALVIIIIKEVYFEKNDDE